MHVVVPSTEVRLARDQASETVVQTMGMQNMRRVCDAFTNIKFLDTAEVPAITAHRITAKRASAHATEARDPLPVGPL
jgi:hypothetical protein